MELLILLASALIVGAIGFGVAVLLTGRDPGLEPTEPDGRAVPLPGFRPLAERDIDELRFDTALRGYRMVQVDAAFQRVAYDLGYKEELINVLEAEVVALREGRTEDADTLRRARDEAVRMSTDDTPAPEPTVEPEAEPEPAILAEADPDAGDADIEGPEAQSQDEAADADAETEGVWGERDESLQRQETKLG
jgi:DivIVA domain-containing protein